MVSPLTCRFLRAHKFKLAGINDPNDFDWEEILKIDFVEDSESESEGESDEQEVYTKEGKFLLVFNTFAKPQVRIT